jgi:hypothetical protein
MFLKVYSSLIIAMKLFPNFGAENEMMVHFDSMTQEVNAGHCYLVAWLLQVKIINSLKV